jgi:hypothetical protein
MHDCHLDGTAMAPRGCEHWIMLRIDGQFLSRIRTGTGWHGDVLNLCCQCLDQPD